MRYTKSSLSYTKLFFFAACCMVAIFGSLPFEHSLVHAQNVIINNTGAGGNPSAMLDVNANNKGLLLPRISLTSATDVTTIPAPAVSLLVYNNATAGASPDNVVPGFYFWDGGRWKSLSGDSGASTVAYADFFALMPPDNAGTVGAGDAVDFPQDGTNNGVLLRANAEQFIIPDAGNYMISWQVSVNEPGQLGIEINGVIQSSTIVGRATGTTQITGNRIITTTTPNSTLRIVNPPGNTPALTITPVAGGTHPVSASITIHRLE